MAVEPLPLFFQKTNVAPMNESMLIIEDEALFGNELKRHFGRRDWDVTLATDLDSARKALFEQGIAPLVVIADMNLPDGNSLDLLEAVRKRKMRGEWIFLTGYGGVTESVRAIQLGAYDFLEKPCERERLEVVVTSARRGALAQRTLSDQTRTEAFKYRVDAFIGRSEAATQVRETLTRLVEIPLSTLIISGESGTGKGLVTRIIHYSGPRCEGPLIELNCAALPKDLLESELFGHEAGAFTDAKGRRRGLIEQANGGTLFLDEIGEMPIGLQSKLLKALEDRRFRRLGGEKEIHIDVQIIAATNRNLIKAIEAGEFREDLYHRLNVFNLALPALRMRKDDLKPLVADILAGLTKQTGNRVTDIPADVWEQLLNYDWPGNVRELRNVLERMLLFSEKGVVSAKWLQLRPTNSETASSAMLDSDVLSIRLDGSVGLEDVERLIIEEMLKRKRGNVAATAEALRTTRETIRYRIKKYRLSPDGVED